jgi:7-cyano-7-deazaguanine reductase
VQIAYKGKKINHEGLLRYIVSFRNDNEFHEQSIEKIFMHIMKYCQPSELAVYGRSTRRGGLDINSYRSTKSIALPAIPNIRLCRQ